MSTQLSQGRVIYRWSSTYIHKNRKGIQTYHGEIEYEEDTEKCVEISIVISGGKY